MLNLSSCWVYHWTNQGKESLPSHVILSICSPGIKKINESMGIWRSPSLTQEQEFSTIWRLDDHPQQRKSPSLPKQLGSIAEQFLPVDHFLICQNWFPCNLRHSFLSLFSGTILLYLLQLFKYQRISIMLPHSLVLSRLNIHSASNHS